MIIVVMGAAGSGKTTVGRLLAARLGFAFEDADDFHSVSNIDKMRRGVALDDGDRAAWLALIDNALKTWRRDACNVVFACSLLKRAYRERVHLDADTRLVYLKASRDELARRLKSREGHFADERLLDSQLAILDEPEGAITVDAARSPQAITTEVRDLLRL